MNLSSRSASCLLVGMTLIAQMAQPTSAVEQRANKNQPATKPRTSADSPVTPQQQALMLLDQLPGQTKDFRSLNRYLKVSLFQSEVANLLWDYDQPRARALLEDAIRTAGGDPSVAAGVTVSPFHTSTYSALCKEIVDFALKHDTAFAEKLVSLSLVPLQNGDPKVEGSDRAYRSLQANLYSHLAERIAASDPQHAADLMRLSFNGWYSGDQISALSALRRSAPALADDMFVNVMAMVRNKPTSISNKLGILAPYIFPDFENGYRRGKAPVDLQPPVSSTLIRAFLEFVYDSFTPQPAVTQTAENNEFGSASFDRHTMQKLIPRFERHLPDKASAFRARIEEVVASIKQAGREDMWDREGEMWGEFFRSNVQDLIKTAEAAKTQTERDENYSNAAGVLAYRDGDFEQALALMAKVSDNDSNKSYELKTYREMRARSAVHEGDPEKAYRYSKDLQDAPSRAECLLGVARLFGKSGNVERAKAVLIEARQAMGTEANNEYQILRRATVAVEINTAFGFQIIKEAIDAINTGDPLVADNTHGIARDTGITFTYRNDFDGNLGVLARTDFNRALELAKSIKLNEASLLAQLAICKGVLGKAGSPTLSEHSGKSRVVK